MKYILLLLLVSCGKVKVNVATEPISPIHFGPNFKEAIEICDSRYGKGTLFSEECFLDYREYLSPKFGVDLKGIIDYCNTTYHTPAEVLGCKNDLLAITRSISGGTKK